MSINLTLETLLSIIGGINTLLVISAFVYKPMRVWFFDKFKKPEQVQNKRLEQIEEKQKRLNNGMRALLADRLHQSCLYFISQECISIGDMANVDLMYEEYKELGGNGVIKNMVMRVRNLEITAGDRCYGSHGNGEESTDDLQDLSECKACGSCEPLK